MVRLLSMDASCKWHKSFDRLPCIPATNQPHPGFKEIPPNSHSLICFHPHGILTVGWALTNTDPVLGHAKIKWLATEALLRLPFISDFLSWNGG